jgi:hypothetical protein
VTPDPDFSDTDLAWFKHPLASPRPSTSALEQSCTVVEAVTTLAAITWLVAMLIRGGT